MRYEQNSVMVYSFIVEKSSSMTTFAVCCYRNTQLTRFLKPPNFLYYYYYYFDHFYYYHYYYYFQVLVMASVGPWESVGGDIKFLRLKQRAIGGLVTNGSVRDTDEVLGYGFPTFSHSVTACQGPAAMQPWRCNEVVNMNGTVVRPGDAIIGDQDGVVVVPAKVAEKVYSIAHGREVIEVIVKEELTKNPGPPGKFYPFMSGKIKPESPLGKLLATKGITPANSNQFEGTADW